MPSKKKQMDQRAELVRAMQELEQTQQRLLKTLRDQRGEREKKEFPDNIIRKLYAEGKMPSPCKNCQFEKSCRILKANNRQYLVSCNLFFGQHPRKVEIKNIYYSLVDQDNNSAILN